MPKKELKVVRATGRRLLEEHLEELPVQLRDDELLARATSLVRLRDEERKHEAAFDVAKKAHNDALAKIADEREKLEQAIRDRREPRPVSVQAWAHYDEGRLREIRTDTGELLNERALLAAEMQETLDLGPVGGDE